jgi:NADPH-dependent 2,4-dienoyl-CoA reductase/sulfur reductase-like enzyme
MAFALILALAALASAHGAVDAAASAAASPPAVADVCVVGAGPAGLAAALALSRRNVTVALLERQAGVGGQTFASYVDEAGFKVHLGAIFLIPDSYPRTVALAKELGIGIEARAVLQACAGLRLSLLWQARACDASLASSCSFAPGV